MLLEASFIDEGKIGAQDVVGGFVVEDADEECDHALGDDGVGIGEVVHFPVLRGGFQPDLRLAAFDEAVFSVEAFVHGSEFFAQSDDILVSLGPILKEVKFVEEFLLLLCDCHVR